MSIHNRNHRDEEQAMIHSTQATDQNKSKQQSSLFPNKLITVLDRIHRAQQEDEQETTRNKRPEKSSHKARQRITNTRTPP